MKLMEKKQTVKINKIPKLSLELLKCSLTITPSACFPAFLCSESVQEVNEIFQR